MTAGAFIVAGALAGLAAGVAGAGAPIRRRVTVAAVLVWVACALEAAAAIRVLSTGHPIVLHFAELLPLTGVDLVLTPLGAFFVLLVAMVAVPATLHGIGYAPHGLDSRMAACAVPIFVTVLLLVPAAGSVATFMVLWELMALASLSLVLVDHGRREAARSAGTWYAVITHVGAALILVAFLILAAHSDGQSFAALRLGARHLAPDVRALVFVLALVGFGSKAGVVPFHVWLPKAHPEAPSPVSALMSGAMVALGVYGIVLVGDVVLGGGPVWWWLVVLALGAASALFGSLHAASSTDMKRLLAYSTTDNVGLALLALGASGLFDATRHPLLAALGLVAALVLLLNHAAFKGALFLSAGSVQTAAGTRDLDQLGGLLRRMPQTGAFFLVAAAAICALPPLNGFIGEWLLFQSLLHGADIGSTAGEIAIPLAVAAMALTAGLTVVAFVKAAGIGFLGRPRSEGADAAVEVPATMRMGVGLLVGVCIVIGVVPTLILPAVERAVRTALPGVGPLSLAHGVNLQLAGLRGVLEPAALAAAMVIAVAGVMGLRRVLARRPAPRVAEAWGCGRELQTARMQYTATSFAEPVQRVFDDVLRPVQDLDVSHVAESRYFVESVTFRNAVDDGIERGLYRPVIGVVRRWGRAARQLQPGSVHRYLAYGLGALVLVLVALAVIG
jgi:formate hydrogenlyase subunit 3/multisubunit Na+/H+ antiporter MnhD subunit